MSFAHELRRRARHFVGPAVGALVVVYFLFHAFYGDRGVLAWIQLRQQVARAEIGARETAARREELEARVALLRSDRLDPDMLDLQARVTAGLAHPDDLVIFFRGGPRQR